MKILTSISILFAAFAYPSLADEELLGGSQSMLSSSYEAENIDCLNCKGPIAGYKYELKSVHKSVCNYISLGVEVQNPFTNQYVRRVGTDVRLDSSETRTGFTGITLRDPNFRVGEKTTRHGHISEPEKCERGPLYYRSSVVFYDGRGQSKRVYFMAPYYLEAFPVYKSDTFYVKEIVVY